jgi:hypothetical protein
VESWYGYYTVLLLTLRYVHELSIRRLLFVYYTYTTEGQYKNVGAVEPDRCGPVESRSLRPESRSPRVVSPSFINSALKNEIWKIPLQIFVFWML